MRALFDTNILIDFLNGHDEARREIQSASDKSISIVTWIEVMAGAKPETEEACRLLLGVFQTLPLSPLIAERAVMLRRTTRLKLPDAVILASAQIAAAELVTRNTRDFAEGSPGVRIPYRLGGLS